MRKSRFASAASGLLVLWAFGCAGSSPPPQSAEDPPPLDDTPAEAAPASSAKVEEAIRLIQAEDYAGAKAVLEQARANNPGDAQTAFYLGVASEGLNDAAAAEQNYQKALELDPKLVDAAVNLSALLLDQEQADRAVAVVDGALQAAPRHPELLTNRALALEALGKAPEAEQAYAAAVAAKPGDMALAYGYARLLADAGKRDQALGVLRKIERVEDPALAGAVANLNGKLGAFAECVAVLDQALKVKPSADLHVRRGVCRHGLKDDAGAEADYRAAIEIDAGFAPAHFYLGQHLKGAGNKAQACAALRKAAELGGSAGVGVAAKKALGELKCK